MRRSAFVLSLSFASLAALLATGCPQPGSPVAPPAAAPPPYVYPQPPVVSMPASDSSVRLREDFEASTTLSLTGSSAGLAPAIATDARYFGSGALKFDSTQLGSVGQLAASAGSITLAQSANLRFYYKTDIGGSLGGVDTWLRLYDGGTKLAEFSGLDGQWKVYDFLLAPGAHSISIRLEKGNSYYYPNNTNCAWIDGLSICDDLTVSVDIAPKGAQRSVVSQPLVTYAGRALRWDGSARAGQAVGYSVVAGTGNGAIDAAGAFTGTIAGTCAVRASSGGMSATSQTMTVLPANQAQLGTVLGAGYYAGITGQTGIPIDASPRTFADPQTGAAVNYQITYPAYATIDADGFMTLTGSASASDPAYQYLYVTVARADDAAKCTTYMLRGSFSTRLWLRFGAGTYVVQVHPCKQTSANLNYEGDFGGWTWWASVASFTVNNARAEDGRFIYPSDPLQADDPRIFNLASSLTCGLADDYWKMRAIHDYVVSLLYYDDASLVAGQRKKQDALSALANGTAVCEGYTSLFGALARAAGVSTKAAGGFGGTGTPVFNHAWNVVFSQGYDRMVDCTWDDPGPNDASPDNIFWDYFLCGLSGVNNDHYWMDDRPSRAPPPAGAAVAAEGGPFGSYPAGWY